MAKKKSEELFPFGANVKPRRTTVRPSTKKSSRSKTRGSRSAGGSFGS